MIRVKCGSTGIISFLRISYSQIDGNWRHLTLHRLFLDHGIIFYFKTTLKIFKKNLSKGLNTFENIKENRAFVLLEHTLHFP